MTSDKQERLLEIFFRSLRGEDLYVSRLADEYGVSTKSITRNLNDLKAFLAEHSELVGHAELRYSYQDRCYRLEMDEFLSDKELFALVEILIGARALSKEELLDVVEKLKRFTSAKDRPKLNELIRREMFQYPEVRHDCESAAETLWLLINCISEHKEITVDYYRMDRKYVTYRLRPLTVMFTDYYFYLIANKIGENEDETEPRYFRVDRIKHTTIHRDRKAKKPAEKYDEGLLRKRSLFMWPGPLRTIRFEFSGPSVQAALDRIPSAKIVEKRGKTSVLEAEVYGDGIKMWLLSQGSWVKVLSPADFVDEMRREIAKMAENYKD